MRNNSITRRAFKLYSSFNKKYFPLLISQVFFQQISPYFNLWISAEIVTALYERSGRESVLWLVIAALAGNLVIHTMNALLGRAVDIQYNILQDNESVAFTKKTLSLDYDKLEDPGVHTLRRKIRENSYINSYGVTHMINTISRLARDICNVVFSLALFSEMVALVVKVKFSLIGLLLFALVIILMLLSNKATVKHGMRVARQDKTIGEMLIEENRLSMGLANSPQEDIRIYRQQDILSEYLRKINKSHLKAFTKFQGFVFTSSRLSFFLNWVSVLCSYLFVCYYCIIGALPVGSLIKYIGAIERFLKSLLDLLSGIRNAFKENEQFLENYLQYFDIPNDMYQGSLSVEKRSDKKYEIEFRNVSFKYAGSEDYALKKVNLTFNVGERLAVVGMNGSGKTTFIKLMCRLYDPTEGEIYMNDFNVRKYDYRQYLDLFSVVFQDYSLLAMSLGLNVASSSVQDRDKAERCLCEVGFGDRYKDMPKGLDTPIYKNFDKDGVNVSGGEAQKIALARALYKDAPFIILDEPTAALDPIAEAEIYAKFDEIVGDKTAIYISHRLSSCRFCDKIVVFDKGEIVQVGSHDELLSDENGKYYELWMSQAQYYT